MAKYVLRPERILPLVPLTEALLWIGIKEYPQTFLDFNDQTFDKEPLCRYLNIEPDGSTTKKYWEKEYETMYEQSHFFHKEHEYKTEIENAKCRLFSAFLESKIKLYGIEPSYYENKEDFIDCLKYVYINEPIPEYEIKRANDWYKYIKAFGYEDILPDNLNYTDFDWDKLSVKVKDRLYREIMVSTDDLFKVYPLELSNSKQVQLGANNYFIDDEDNNEIELPETRGRKSSLTPSQIATTACYCKDLLNTNPNESQKFYVLSCTTWLEKEFKTKIPYETVRGWLIDILPKRNNEN